MGFFQIAKVFAFIHCWTFFTAVYAWSRYIVPEFVDSGFFMTRDLDLDTGLLSFFIKSISISSWTSKKSFKFPERGLKSSRDSNCLIRRKIRLIESNAKCRHLKWSGKSFRSFFLSVWSPLPSYIFSLGVVEQFCRFRFWSDTYSVV